MEYFYLYLLGFLGLVLHWLKKYLKAEEKLNFIDYMKVNSKSTYSSILALLLTTTTYISTIDIVLLNHQTIALAILAGFACNSTFNKGSEE
jgi:hypothetical protein